MHNYMNITSFVTLTWFRSSKSPLAKQNGGKYEFVMDKSGWAMTVDQVFYNSIIDALQWCDVTTIM